MTKPKALTPKQERFCLAYLEGASGSDAYRKVYKPKRATAKSVHEMASALLANPKVASRVAELRGKAADRSVLTLEKTVAQLARLVNADPADYFKADGKIRDLSEMPSDARAAIASLEIEDDEVKLRFYDKNTAIHTALKHLGGFEKDNRQKLDPVTKFLEWAIGLNAKSGTHGLPVKR